MSEYSSCCRRFQREKQRWLASYVVAGTVLEWCDGGFWPGGGSMVMECCCQFFFFFWLHILGRLVLFGLLTGDFGL